MSKINLTIDLDNKSRFISKYNKKTLNSEIRQFILNELVGYSTKEKLKIHINTSFEISEEEEKEYSKILKKEFRENYTDLKDDAKMIYNKSIILILIGVILVAIYYVSTNIHDTFMAEIINIVGWLLIWESGYAIIYTLADKRKEILRYNQVVKSEIEFN